MAKMLNVSIDVTKIDKEQLVQGKKVNTITGKVSQYLNLTVAISDNKDKYGNDVSCWQSQEQDARERGEERLYLGNGRVFWSKDTPAQRVAKEDFGTSEASVVSMSEEVPF